MGDVIGILVFAPLTLALLAQQLLQVLAQLLVGNTAVAGVGRTVVLLLVLQLLIGAQLDGDLLLFLAAHERDLDLLAHLVAAQRDDQAIGARDLVVAQLGDDVALLNAGLGSRTILNDARHIRAAIGAQLVGAGVERVDARKRSAHVRMHRCLAVDDLVGNVLGIVDRNGKTHARVGAIGAIGAAFTVMVCGTDVLLPALFETVRFTANVPALGYV